MNRPLRSLPRDGFIRQAIDRQLSSSYKSLEFSVKLGSGGMEISSGNRSEGVIIEALDRKYFETTDS